MPSASIRRSLGSCLSVMFKAEQWFDLYFLDNDLHFLDNDLCELRPVLASVPYSKGNATRRYASLDVPHGTSSCGIFATLGEYFCSITLLGDFPVRISQLEHVGGRAAWVSRRFY